MPPNFQAGIQIVLEAIDKNTRKVFDQNRIALEKLKAESKAVNELAKVGLLSDANVIKAKKGIALAMANAQGKYSLANRAIQENDTITRISTKGFLNRTRIEERGIMVRGKFHALSKKVISGEKAFRMEMLGVMFAGMQVSKMFGDMTKGAMDWLGIGELFQTSLNLIALEGLMPMADSFYTFIQSLIDLPIETKKAMGSMMFIGQIGGVVLQTFGALILALSSLMMVSKGFAGPVVAAFGAVLDVFAPMIGAIPGMGGLTEPLKALGSFMKIGGIAFTGITIFEDLGKLLEIWKTLGDNKAIGLVLSVTDYASAVIKDLMGIVLFGGMTLGNFLLIGTAAVTIFFLFKEGEDARKSVEKYNSAIESAIESGDVMASDWASNMGAIRMGGQTTFTLQNQLIDELLQTWTHSKDSMITKEDAFKVAVEYANAKILSNSKQTADEFLVSWEISSKNSENALRELADKTPEIAKDTTTPLITYFNLTAESVRNIGYELDILDGKVIDITIKKHIEEERKGIFGMGGFLGIFQHGGIVPGRFGEPVPIIAHGGERFMGVRNEYGGGSTVNFNPTYNIAVSDAREFESMIKANNNDMIAELKRMVI